MKSLVALTGCLSERKKKIYLFTTITVGFAKVTLSIKVDYLQRPISG